MTFAAMLLMSVSAFAQSNEPLYGDVNYDGVVDVGDINAIIAIIKNYAATQTTYYWYVSQKKPTASTTLPILDNSSNCFASRETTKYYLTLSLIFAAYLNKW